MFFSPSHHLSCYLWIFWVVGHINLPHCIVHHDVIWVIKICTQRIYLFLNHPRCISGNECRNMACMVWWHCRTSCNCRDGRLLGEYSWCLCLRCRSWCRYLCLCLWVDNRRLFVYAPKECFGYAYASWLILLFIHINIVKNSCGVFPWLLDWRCSR